MLGIIGGLGPRATCDFYASFMARVAARNNGGIPQALIYNVPMNPAVENAYLKQGGAGIDAMRPHVRRILSQAIDCFLLNGVKTSVLPCNTLQTEFVDLCREKCLDCIDMIDNTVRRIADSGVATVLVFGTSNTCAQDVYGGRLKPMGIRCRYPTASQQEWVEKYIRRALDMSVDGHWQSCFAEQARSMSAGVDGVVLACTDLSGDLETGRFGLPVFDSLQLLAEASADYVTGRQELFLLPPEAGL